MVTCLILFVATSKEAVNVTSFIALQNPSEIQTIVLRWASRQHTARLIESFGPIEPSVALGLYRSLNAANNPEPLTREKYELHRKQRWQADLRYGLGKGLVVTFSDGWPLNADAWHGQMLFLAQHGPPPPEVPV